MKILVACEFSGVVRDAFAAKGHDAWSCDLLEAVRGGQHIQGDCLEILDRGWDMMIAHPPCTFLSVSGLHWNERGRGWQGTFDAIAFVEKLWAAPIRRICIENPVGCLSTRSTLGKPAGTRGQTVQPYEYGDDASKRTCLWLKALPRLMAVPEKRLAGRMVEWPRGSGKMVERWANQTDSGQNALPPSDDRWADRSVTYQGIADAMAEAWGNL